MAARPRHRSCRRCSRVISRSAPCRTFPRRSRGSEALLLGIDRRSVQNFDWTLLGLIVLLSAAGLVNLYSATWAPDGLSDEMRRQLLSLGIGTAVAVVCTAI